MGARPSEVESTFSRPAPDPVTRYAQVRMTSLAICEPLAIEDYVVQSMPDASPAKWHLAHTTWFFEQFLLKPHAPNYRPFDPQYEFLFNSYYQTIGPMHRRAERGLLTRPSVSDIARYRQHVDGEMQRLLTARADDTELLALTTLGLNHEQQHQELMLTDLKHLFSLNPLLPAYLPAHASAAMSDAMPLEFVPFEGGIRSIGADHRGFHFDNEGPRHRALLQPFEMANRLITNGEFADFIADRGYQRPELWLSDGWSTVNTRSWRHPLYWDDTLQSEFTLRGFVPLDRSAPVCHLSFYEADAYARWAGARLPTEFEWEVAATAIPLRGNLLGSQRLHPSAASAESSRMHQVYGDVWEWTSSAYSPYPGFQAPQGALGEYNGKFMINQLVLRGGSCVTPENHIRASYRNFFYPDARWQFMGVRLARDVH